MLSARARAHFLRSDFHLKVLSQLIPPASVAVYQQTPFFQRLREDEPPPTPPALVSRDEYGSEYADGSEWEGAAAAKPPEEKKQQIRGACQRAESRKTN